MAVLPGENLDLVIGVDGGKTKTLTALAAVDGTLLAVAATGPCNHIYEPGGLERQYKALRGGYEACFASAGLALRRARSVYLGLSGAGDRATVESVYDAALITLSGDAPTALSGAIPSMQGVIIIAGTGSAAYGRDATGQEVVAGGHGYYAGDEGSGYYIAQRAFRAAYQASDARAPETALTDMLLAHYGEPTLRILRDKIYGVLSRDQLAGAAILVTEAAANGDAVAADILRGAGVELGQTVAAVLARLNWRSGLVPVAPVGSVFKAGDAVKAPMMDVIQATNPDAYLQEPRFPPVIGAVLLAMRVADIDVSEQVLGQIERTYAALK